MMDLVCRRCGGVLDIGDPNDCCADPVLVLKDLDADEIAFVPWEDGDEE